MDLRAHNYVTSALASLYWLPIVIESSVKSRSPCFIHTNQSPAYLGNIITPLHNNHWRQRIRSSNGTDYLIPQTRMKLGERSFSAAGPTTWNSLPETVRAVTDNTAFKRVLKTNLLISLLILHRFKWRCNASSVRLVVDVALNTLLLLLLLSNRKSLKSLNSKNESEPVPDAKAILQSPLVAFLDVLSADVLKVLSSLLHKSSPCDILLTSLLKSWADLFAPMIAHLTNSSFTEGTFPTLLKTVQVLPQLKKPGVDRFNPGNYPLSPT